jgi:Fe-S cluster biogenesis protein NfuA
MQEQIQAKLDELRELLQADGGDLEFVRLEGKTLFLRLTGACGSCPHATVNLRNYIEHNLRLSIDPELTVERVK